MRSAMALMMLAAGARVAHPRAEPRQARPPAPLPPPRQWAPLPTRDAPVQARLPDEERQRVSKAAAKRLRRRARNLRLQGGDDA